MVKIVIPGELPALNQYSNAERSNRYYAGRLKDNYTNICSVYTKKAMREGLTVDGKIDIHCHWYVKNKRKDKDNIRFAIKFIQDGMIQAGLIENDGWSEIGNYFDAFSVDKDNPRVEVLVLPHKEE